jgi:hypothetical protein
MASEGSGAVPHLSSPPPRVTDAPTQIEAGIGDADQLIRRAVRPE